MLVSSASAKSYKVGVITTSRADFSIYLPVLRALRDSKRVDVGLIATGMHLRHDLGYSIKAVEQSGFPIWARPEILLSSDTAAAATKAMGLCHLALADVLEETQASGAKIDLLLALGDRFEMLAAVSAAQPFLIPVAHIAGGDDTEGAIDNNFRHAITKLSHLHFVTTELSRRRVVAMGEDPSRVFAFGTPALDAVPVDRTVDRDWLAREFGVPLGDYLLATVHSETLVEGGGDVSAVAQAQIELVLAAVREIGLPCLFTAANADPGGAAINAVLRAAATEAASGHSIKFVENLGGKGYFPVLASATAVIGNSSSGIVEAASFELPVVNIGDRQKGREQTENILNVGWDKDAIKAAIARAISPEFRLSLRGLQNIYGDSNAAPRITEAILAYLDGGAPIRKAFHLG